MLCRRYEEQGQRESGEQGILEGKRRKGFEIVSSYQGLTLSGDLFYIEDVVYEGFKKEVLLQSSGWDWKVVWIEMGRIIK